ncbi:uncharacterized protein CLAFUR5_11835 [Fulvia fulva]|uniref:Uncharacterized protein n=1 Tax=Passalora fulva TaxID=5499 RepID=A0A9Q8PHU7_PASFU|nr:uncharacterized protein CLAFUR5_11835 [Fulvia fulva]KAK4628416.1 hypothetical protein CLAFUR0_05062 [Fulvia fulva]UJO22919.1 hypothetical protein CLAFUR5_11835 [Fulvia fulva]WPV28076.1 hypothetical protein CLAFUW7_05066 [Fulvia fulva]
MRGDNYSVASAAQYGGFGRRGSDDISEEVQVMDYGANNHETKRQSNDQKRVRIATNGNHGQEAGEHHPSTEVFTHSRNASWNSSSPVSAIPDSLTWAGKPRELVQQPPDTLVELLKPVAYTPPKTRSDSALSNGSNDSAISVKERVADFEAQVVPPTPKASENPLSRPLGELTIDTEARHARNESSSSTSSTRRRRQSKGLEIFFTPIDVRKSKIFLSSPQGSPTFAGKHETPERGEEDLPTPKAPSRPVSQVYVGNRRPSPKKTSFKIKPAQLDQLVNALAKSPLIQKDVRKHWWDVDDIPDDETIGSFSSVSLPTLTSASTLYSQPNQPFLGDHRSSTDRRAILEAEFARDFPNHPNAKKPIQPTNISFGGVALTDPTVHGSPVRYVSRDYRSGANLVQVGSCSFLTVPYGTEVECMLRVESPNTFSPNSQVMLQCANQVVMRKTGARKFLLSAEIDVTTSFACAALAELAAAIDKDASEIEVVPTSPAPLESPDIDWVAIADELQATSLISDTIDTITPHFGTLTRETATDATLTLLAELEVIKDKHSDFIILEPTSFHDNGMPASIRLPWVSQRLYHDWYETEKGHGNSATAEAFKQALISKVAKNTLAGVTFGCGLKWDCETLIMRCVPLRARRGEEIDAWACFVEGMVEE